MKEFQASPELAKFFEHLSHLKKFVFMKLEQTDDEDIREIYEELNRIFKTKEEENA